MIDAVYTWVDGSDPTWLEERRRAIARYGREISDFGLALGRFISRDEFLYSLRSIEQYAPYIRKVHVVTAHQVPEWLNSDHPDLNLVSHEDIFPRPEFVPNYNSRAIEANLHRIPGLAERFLYMNDDFMLAAPTTERDFFDEAGRVLFYLENKKVVWDRNNPRYSQPGLIAARKGSALLEQDFSFRIHDKIDHVPYAMTRSLASEVWEKYPKELMETCSHIFRDPEDLKLLSSFANFYGVCTGRAVAVRTSPSAYIKIKKKWFTGALVAAMLLKLRFFPRQGTKFICLNDSDVPDRSWLTLRAIDAFLDSRYPLKSRFEK